MTDALGTGVAFPLGVDQRGGIALARGGTDVEQALRLILTTAPGERPMRPDFGCAVHDHVFDVIDIAALGQIEHAVRVAVERWEPRVEVVGVDFDLTRQRQGRLNVELTYALRDVPGVRNLVHPFYVMPDEGADEGEIVDGEVVA